jgi:hypothetical protein
MKSRIGAAVAVLTTVVVLTACGSDKKSTSTTATPGGLGVTVPTGETVPSESAAPNATLPSGLTVPPGGTFPADMTIPESVVDAIISQLEQAGLKVDRACFEDLLQDENLRRMVLEGTTPSVDLIQQLTACIQQ